MVRSRDVALIVTSDVALDLTQRGVRNPGDVAIDRIGVFPGAGDPMRGWRRLPCTLVFLLFAIAASADPGPVLAPGVGGTLELVTPDAADQAELDEIDGLAFDSFGNLFGAREITGSAGGVVYIDKDTGTVVSLVTGIECADQIALHTSGDFFVTSEVSPGSSNQRLYRVTPTYTSNVPTGASKVSVETSFPLDNPEGLVVLENTNAYGIAGDLLLVEDRRLSQGGGRVLQVNPDTGPPATATTLVASAILDKPEGAAFGDFSGAEIAALYVAESANNRVIRIEPNGSFSTLGSPLAVALTAPDNVEFGPDGFLYVSEDRPAPDSRIIRIAPDGTHSVLATGFGQASGLIFDPDNGDLYIAEQDFDVVWRYVPEPSGTLQLATMAAFLAAIGRKRSRRRRNEWTPLRR